MGGRGVESCVSGVEISSSLLSVGVMIFKGGPVRREGV